MHCLLLIEYTEIPRVITALQQQNTAPEVQQYDADPYQTDSDGGGGGGGAGGGSGSGRGEITICAFFTFLYPFQANKKKRQISTQTDFKLNQFRKSKKVFKQPNFPYEIANAFMLKVKALS